ncbi:MAG: hypothetical protein N2255_09165 [Kiritimatiellae bacterium]|nr:hypothetical protein [Kiritimatiellia bacterium]
MRPGHHLMRITALAAGIATTSMGSGTVRFVGGSYDGHARADWTPTVLETLAVRFHGGPCDGHGLSQRMPTNTRSLALRFCGGHYDGHAQEGWEGTVLRELAFRFLGGFHDGHAQGEWTPTVVSTLGKRFHGGNRDGHDGVTVPIFRFRIVSTHGVASPPPGLYVHSLGASLTNTVTAEQVSGTTQYVARGWSLSGHNPASGRTLWCIFTITNDAVLTWLWNTNYWLATIATRYGAVTPPSGWQPAGSNVLLRAVADAYCHLVRWSGDIPSGQETNATFYLHMDRAKSVTATFAQTLAALGTPHWWLAGHHLTNGGVSFDEAETRNPDGDAHLSWEEWVADTDPTNAASCLQLTHFDPGPPVMVHFRSSSNRLYILQICSNLLQGGWLAVPGGRWRLGVGGPDSMVDTNVVTGPRFYRLKVQKP